MQNSTSTSSATAGERFFRLYGKHCVEPDQDTLFNLLNSIHSLNDRLNKATGKNFFECHEFIALKALRNLFHHEAELINQVRPILVANVPSISTDLIFLCLVPADLVVRSIEQIDKRWSERDGPIIRATLKWYAGVVNINPCIFNFAVHAFEKLKALEISVAGVEYDAFARSYRFEEEFGHSHFVNGDISTHAGSIEQVLAVAFADVA